VLQFELCAIVRARTFARDTPRATATDRTFARDTPRDTATARALTYKLLVKLQLELER
jgi:hypothetical protein